LLSTRTETRNPYRKRRNPYKKAAVTRRTRTDRAARHPSEGRRLSEFDTERGYLRVAAHWTDQRLPLKPRRKPLPAWLVVILALIAEVVAAAVVDALADRVDHHDSGMSKATIAQVLAGDAQ
jgi:hypothetical protein